MKSVLKFFNERKKRNSDKRNRINEQVAEELFQAKEFFNDIWLTYNGHLVCPASMLKDGIVEALGTMRGLYVTRNSNSKEYDTRVLQGR